MLSPGAVREQSRVGIGNILGSSIAGAGLQQFNSFAAGFQVGHAYQLAAQHFDKPVLGCNCS